jgi:hypothetical protein
VPAATTTFEIMVSAFSILHVITSRIVDDDDGDDDDASLFAKNDAMAEARSRCFERVVEELSQL